MRLPGRPVRSRPPPSSSSSAGWIRGRPWPRAERSDMTRYAPSILDRLVAPKAKGEVGEHRLDSLAAFEAALQRDLIALLNTRTAREPVPPVYREAATSLLAFGLPDLAGQNLRLASEQNRLRREIENAIRLFEPRLSGVNVTVEQWDEVK